MAGVSDGTVRDPVRQRRTVDQFHHQCVDTHGGVLEPVDLRDVRMIERREKLRLALEAGAAVGVARHRVRQYLQRDVAIESGVSGAINLAHSARTDGREHFVRADATADGEWH